MRSIPWSIFAMTTFLVLITNQNINTRQYCDAATSFFPQTSSTKQAGSSDNTAIPKKKKKTITQRNIATTRPHTTPVDFWSPQFELFIQRQRRSTSNKKDQKYELNLKYGVQSSSSSSTGAFNLDWVEQLLLQNQMIMNNLRIESIQFISDHFTLDVLQSIWQSALAAVEEQLPLHIYNNAEKTATVSTSARNTKELVAAGDFLCEINGWSAYFDRANTCLIYYFHRRTGISQWNVPFPNFPTPTLNHDQLQLMRQKISEHQQPLNAVGRIASPSTIISPHLASNIFQGIQDMIHQRGVGGSNNKRDPDKKKPDPKPWWSSVLDIVFESSGADGFPNDPVVDNKKGETPSAAADEPLPFFAAFANEKSRNTVVDLPSSMASKIPEPQSFDIVTTLSPWWDLLRDAVVKSATTAIESQSATNAKSKIKIVEKIEDRTNLQPWDHLISSMTEMKKDNMQSTITVKSSVKGQSRPQQPAKELTTEVEINKNVIGWMSDLPLFLTRDVSRTVPLFSLFPKKTNGISENKKAMIVTTQPVLTMSPSNDSATGSKLPTHAERLKIIEENRYAASRARQANLRKTYGTIIHDRSPTVSLSSIKLRKSKSSSKNDIDWYKYLDD